MIRTSHTRILGLAAGVCMGAGAALAAPSDELIDLSGVSLVSDLSSTPAFDAPTPSPVYASAPTDERMTELLIEMTPEGGAPVAAPAPLSGLMGAVGLGVLAAGRRRRD